MSRYIHILKEHMPENNHDIDYLVDNKAVLTIGMVDNHERKARVIFNHYLAYRKIDESAALTTLDEISKDLAPGKTFYHVEDSEFLEWFHRQNYGIWKDRKPQHYLLAMDECLIDVIFLGEPKIEYD